MSDPKSIAESVLGSVDWFEPDKGYCQCPGKNFHTGGNAKRDCRVILSGAPTISCFHDSCAAEVAAANKTLRRSLGIASKSIRHTFRDSEPPRVHSVAPASKVKHYELRQADGLPAALPDGARELIRAAFEPGEGVCIVLARHGDDGREVPKDEGVVLSREEWLSKLDKVKGEPNGIFSNSQKNGIYIRMNPMRLGGSKDSDVTAFRHALIESDSISDVEQWRHVCSSGAPVTAVIKSGGKSVHAWVRVDAKDRKEYDERVKLLHDHFNGNGFKVDGKNRNPSRFSRLPNCVRGKSRQELLALRLGADSFGAWHAELFEDSIGRIVTIDKLRTFKAEEDPNCLIGARWLCRGGSCLFVGPSGVGKSSLSVQAAVSWALGRPFFGIAPRRPLKSVFIQAENDDGDLAEMTQGVLEALGIEQGSPDDLRVIENVIFISDDSRTGEVFTKNVQRIVDKYRPDLCWFDPMLSFIGDDISKQSVCSQFLRNWLAPISGSSGVTWMVMHHAGKPKEDKQGKKNWTKTDHSYAGLGSSEIVNWARAVCVLERVDDKNFCLLLAKRGKRAQARDVNGELTERLWLQHAEDRIEWVQVKEPQPVSKHKVSKREAIRALDHQAPPDLPILEKLRGKIDGFCMALGSDRVSLREAARRFRSFAQLNEVEMCERQSIECINLLVDEAKLQKTKPAKKGEPCEIFA